MQTALSQQRCLPASTSGRCSPTSFDCSEDCPGSSGRLLGRLAKSRTLLLRRGSALRGSYSRRCSLLPACCQPRAAGHVGALQIRSSAAKRDVRAQARSTAGQVGVAAVEEVVDAPHPEVLSYSSLPVSFAARTVRDSYLSVQNVESLTRELAEVGEHLERLVASEDTPSSRAYSVRLMSCIFEVLFLMDDLGVHARCETLTCGNSPISLSHLFSTVPTFSYSANPFVSKS